MSEFRPTTFSRFHDVICREFARRPTDERLAEQIEEWS